MSKALSMQKSTIQDQMLINANLNNVGNTVIILEKKETKSPIAIKIKESLIRRGYIQVVY